MGKAARTKREEKPAEKEDGYEFKLPAFDETTFIRRELQSARASFYTLGIGVAGGVLAVATFLLPVPWYTGWLPILAAMASIRPILKALKFSDEVTGWKGLIGFYFMVFFTGLALWILGVNLI